MREAGDSLGARTPPRGYYLQSGKQHGVLLEPRWRCFAVASHATEQSVVKIPRVVNVAHLCPCARARAYMGCRPAHGDVPGLKRRAHRRPTSHPGPSGAAVVRKQPSTFASAPESSAGSFSASAPSYK